MSQIEISFSHGIYDPLICQAEATFRGHYYVGTGTTWDEAKEKLVQSIINGQRTPPPNQTIEIPDERLSNADAGIPSEQRSMP